MAMTPEINLHKLVRGMTPKLNEGEYVFTVVNEFGSIDLSIALCTFKENEGITLIVNRIKADELGLSYDFVANWITLEIQSSLEAVGLTAVFSNELAKNNISCNVVAGFHHDHIFVPTKDSIRAMEILENLSSTYRY